jgi:ribosomal protein L11 methyltransferase
MSADSTWFAVAVLCPLDAVDAIESGMNILGADGIETDSLGRKDFSEQKVVGYFAECPVLEEVHEAVKSSLEAFGIPSDITINISISEVENEDWLAEWKKNWKPTVTGRFIVAPAWQEVDAGDRIVIRIDPSMAFGTGTHETTRLCLKSIETNYRDGESFLDVGTGTGILAIGAAMLHAKGVVKNFYGCDTDEDSVTIAIENALLNGVTGIDFEHARLEESAPIHDFTCANLTADVILPILPLLMSKTRRVLVLSGILREQESDVTTALETLGAKDFHVERDGEWIGITIKISSTEESV